MQGLGDLQGFAVKRLTQDRAALGVIPAVSRLQREGFRVVPVDTRYDRVQQARAEGLTVHYADVLSEYILDTVDFSGIGRFLALTSNGDVNALAVIRFREIFGSFRETKGARPTCTLLAALGSRRFSCGLMRLGCGLVRREWPRPHDIGCALDSQSKKAGARRKVTPSTSTSCLRKIYERRRCVAGVVGATRLCYAV